MLDAYISVFSLNGLMWVSLGTAIGILVGAIPGLSGAMIIALALPVTYFMMASDALLLLISMYVGGAVGGITSAVLIRMPGSESNIMTALDGAPMAERGEPARALGIGVIASFIGGLFAWAVMATLSPTLAKVAVRFGPYEIFALSITALTLIAAVSKGNFINGLMAAGLGALLSMPGMEPVSGSVRLTFGISALESGFSLLPVMLGLLVMSQVLADCASSPVPPKKSDRSKSGKVLIKLADIRDNTWHYIRSCVIGSWIGILPGIGGTTAAVASYAVAKTTSKEPETFGNGAPAGIVSAECANSAATVGSLIPMITLGIPGSVITAILLGAMVIHDLNPGPLLFSENPQIVHTIIAGTLASNVVMLLIMWVTTPLLARLMYVKRSYLLPPIVVFCFIGAFSVSHSLYDVYVMMGFALLGYLMQKSKLPIGPFIIAFILMPIAESNLRSGLILYGDSYLPLITRPVSAAFLGVAVLCVLWVIKGEFRKKPTKQTA